MQVKICIASKTFDVAMNKFWDISIPLLFNDAQPNAYGVPHATSKAVEGGSFVGDTRRSGSCNCEEYRLIPHCNGTHTECVGHIAKARISIHQTLKQAFIPATLISIPLEKAERSSDSCCPKKNVGDLFITQQALLSALLHAEKEFLQAAIIRTLPNDESKKTRDYTKEEPAFFSTEAMQYLVSLGVEHLLVDVPSLDRASDEGKLTTHHIFWNVPQNSSEVDIKQHSLKTVTEMIFVSNEIKDGTYFLNLQIPSFVADAAPSRPIIFPIMTEHEL